MAGISVAAALPLGQAAGGLPHPTGDVVTRPVKPSPLLLGVNGGLCCAGIRSPFAVRDLEKESEWLRYS